MGVEGKVRAEEKRGKIDHATAGAQLIWDRLGGSKLGRALAQMLSVSVMSHHARKGMKDFVALDGSSPFINRAKSPREKTHFNEVLSKGDCALLSEIEELLKSNELLAEFRTAASRIEKAVILPIPRSFHYGALTRFLFSCLLDADRLNTADFEKPKSASFRTIWRPPDWTSLAKKLDTHLSSLSARNNVDLLRNQISNECLSAAAKPRGIFTLTVPTGGGKTLASLRFALNHAAIHSNRENQERIERIIFVIPYTSIIDQNARVVRSILGEEVVLEHHSNIVPETDTWRNRVLSENWDAPIIFTTSVQLLNALFDKSTNSTRRMHQLANAIIIFDEIQTLPIKTIHIFNNSVNFLVNLCHSTVVFCTATQPLIGEVEPTLGAAAIGMGSEIVEDATSLFKKLKRTSIIDQRRPGGWTFQEVSAFTLDQLAAHRSVLIVVNTKEAALQIYQQFHGLEGTAVIHLSTHMCPAHRKAKLNQINECLRLEDGQPVICVSTQLIEAGVDLDFGCVIRSLAGLDSIAQAGGRCNRNGNRACGPIHIVNLSEEKISMLPEIRQAQECTETVLDNFRKNPMGMDDDLLSPAGIRQYYEYHFFQRASEMTYPLKAQTKEPQIAADTSMLHLLSENPVGAEEYGRQRPLDEETLTLRHAFSTAAQSFKVIDAPTRGIVVPYGKEGQAIIGELAAAFTSEDYPLDKQIPLLRRAQQFTVNVFPGTITKLNSNNAIREVQAGSGIYYLDDRHYHKDLGVTHEALSDLQFYDT